MATFRISYQTYIDVEAENEDEAREQTCNPQAEAELLSNLQELTIQKA